MKDAYSKEINIQTSEGAAWQHLFVSAGDDKVSHFRDGFLVEPFDIEAEYRSAYRASLNGRVWSPQDDQPK